jgi:hypothetical protein
VRGSVEWSLRVDRLIDTSMTTTNSGRSDRGRDVPLRGDPIDPSEVLLAASLWLSSSPFSINRLSSGSEVPLFFDRTERAGRWLCLGEDGLDSRLELGGEPHTGDGVELGLHAPHALASTQLNNAVNRRCHSSRVTPWSVRIRATSFRRRLPKSGTIATTATSMRSAILSTSTAGCLLSRFLPHGSTHRRGLG